MKTCKIIFAIFLLSPALFLGAAQAALASERRPLRRFERPILKGAPQEGLFAKRPLH
jgi:hypothetical protein